MRHLIPLMVIAFPFGCSGSGRPIEFVVPKGHTGPVWVRHDPAAPDLPVVNGRYQVIFSSDGVCRVPHMRPFEQWHETSARYDDGTPLPASLLSGSSHSDVAPGTVGMWAGPGGSTWPDKRDYIMWVVGTEQEYQTFVQGKTAPPSDK